jgi:hypothetical protein
MALPEPEEERLLDLAGITPPGQPDVGPPAWGARSA